jgi:hypothetical protein
VPIGTTITSHLAELSPGNLIATVLDGDDGTINLKAELLTPVFG